MELKVIQRDGHPKEVIAVPTLEEGVISGVIRSPRGVGLFEVIGAGVLLRNLPHETIQKVEGNPTEKLPEYLKPVDGRPHSIKLINGVEGVIYETLDRDLDPVRGRRLILDGFNEYAPYPGKINPLIGPMGSIDSR